MKAGGGHRKGSQFERRICIDLSRWWTDGKRDDVFWRSPQSGGRATSRAKKGISTFGHYGDVQAVDPIGRPLLELMTIELKCGYVGTSPLDLIDGQVGSVWGKWLHHLVKDANSAGSRFWALIVQRPRRKSVIVVPELLCRTAGVLIPAHNDQIMVDWQGYGDCLMIFRLMTFFDWCHPANIKDALLSSVGGVS